MPSSLRSLLVLSILPACATECSKTRSLASFEGRIAMQTTKGADVRDMRVTAKGEKLRFDLVAADGSKTHAVYDATDHAMTLFLDGPKQYLPLDFASAPSVPNTNPTTSTIVKAGAHKTVAGYDCEEWTVKDAAQHRTEVCIAQGIAYFDPTRLRPGAAREPENALAREFREKKSYPLESVEYDADGKELSRTVVTSIEAASVVAADFAVPPGYAKLELPPR